VDRNRILARDDHTCLWCETRFDSGNLDVHHLVPRQLDGPDDDWNLSTLCRHHHLLMNVAAHPSLTQLEQWWEAGEANLALGECFAWGLAARSRTETEMPQHVQDAITEAFHRMCSPLPDRYWDGDDWSLADILGALGNPLMSVAAA
jgi:hypothetical protein